MIWNRRGFLTMCTAVGASVRGVLGQRMPAEKVDVWAMTDEEVDQSFDEMIKANRDFWNENDEVCCEYIREPPGWYDDDLPS